MAAKKENVKVEEPIEEVVEEEIEMKEGFLTKAKNFGKKHGKKLAVAGGVAVAFIVGKAIGGRSNDDYCDYDLLDHHDDNDNVIDITDIAED